jgi:hypothetical protein
LKNSSRVGCLNRSELIVRFPDVNGTSDWQLPIPATFAIAPNGKILLAHIDADYRNRLEPSEALAVITREQFMNQNTIFNQF